MKAAANVAYAGCYLEVTGELEEVDDDCYGCSFACWEIKYRGVDVQPLLMNEQICIIEDLVINVITEAGF